MMRFSGSTAVFAIALFALLTLSHRAEAASPAGEQAREPAKTEATSGCPCECGCGESGGDACGKMGAHGHMHGGQKMHPMMEGMKRHVEEVRKNVAALREHEKKLEGIADPAEFRKAVIEHFRMLDDLHASHVTHMDSMMEERGERMQRGHEHPHH